MPHHCKNFLGALSMELRKFAACTVCVIIALAAAGCAEGTGQALTPTLPSIDSNTANADGTKLKASAPQPLSPQSAIRGNSLTPELVLRNASGNFAASAVTTHRVHAANFLGSIEELPKNFLQ